VVLTQVKNCRWSELELEQLWTESDMGLQSFSVDFPLKAGALCKGLYGFQGCSTLTSAWSRGIEMTFCFLNRLMSEVHNEGASTAHIPCTALCME